MRLAAATTAALTLTMLTAGTSIAAEEPTPDPYYGSGQFSELVAAAGQGSTGATKVNEVTRIDRGASLKLEGLGFGHGRGMSQFGARGAAELGLAYTDILGFYYPGTTLTKLPDKPIRVWLEADDDGATAVVSDGVLQVRDARGAGPKNIPAGTQVIVTENFDGGMSVWSSDDEAEDGDWIQLHDGPGPITLTSTSQTIQVFFPDDTRSEYSGSIQAIQTDDGFKTLNVLPMEDYLLSVVPMEMETWFPPEAMQAQAVAARTYSAGERNTFAYRDWDICDSTQCQVYGGIRKYDADGMVIDEYATPQSSAAVSATAGQVLTDERGEIALAQFSSSNGGWTTEGKNGEPYLVARQDMWDCVDNYAYPWTATISSAQLMEHWPEVGTPNAITVTERNGNGTWGGRALNIRIDGSKGSVDVPGEDFRIALGLRSNWFRVSGTAANGEEPATPAVPRTSHIGAGSYVVPPTAPSHLCAVAPTVRDLRALWSAPATFTTAK